MQDITSVSKKDEQLFDTASAVSVCSLSGNNLLNQSHGEYINTFFQQGLSEVERTVMLKLDYHY